MPPVDLNGRFLAEPSATYESPSLRYSTPLVQLLLQGLPLLQLLVESPMYSSFQSSYSRPPLKRVPNGAVVLSMYHHV